MAERAAKIKGTPGLVQKKAPTTLTVGPSQTVPSSPPPPPPHPHPHPYPVPTKHRFRGGPFGCPGLKEVTATRATTSQPWFGRKLCLYEPYPSWQDWAPAKAVEGPFGCPGHEEATGNQGHDFATLV
ncbi:hypothetical protein LWI29_011073, partial [Acer saccharum]